MGADNLHLSGIIEALYVTAVFSIYSGWRNSYQSIGETQKSQHACQIQIQLFLIRLFCAF